MPGNIDNMGKIKKVAETIVSAQPGSEPECLYTVALTFTDLDREDYIRLARACLGKEPVEVSITMAQQELPLSEDGQHALPLAAPMPGVLPRRSA